MTALARTQQRCVSCGSRLLEIWHLQPALVRHGGYGATERTTVEVCPKGCSMRVASVTTERP